MGWFVRERRGLGWKNETLESISAPPLALVVFFGVFIMLMCFASYSEFKQKVERRKIGLRLGLLLLPLVGALVANVMMLSRRRLMPVYEVAATDEESWPWGLFLVVALLLVMVYYQSSFQSALFRSF